MGENLVKTFIKKYFLRSPAALPVAAPANPAPPVSVEPPNDPKKVFTSHYQNNFWGNPESVSGAGSTMEYTRHLRQELPGLLTAYKVRRFLDAPCGDFNWFQAVQLPEGVEYIGGDIVDELVERNRQQYARPSLNFMSLNIISDPLPAADLWMCRDCLFHFSYRDIFKTLSNFVHSDIEYLLTSIHVDCQANSDILTGGARLMHLELAPFNFPKALLYIEDWIPGFKVRRMGLWTKSMVASALTANPEARKWLQ